MKTKLIARWLPRALTTLGFIYFAAEPVCGATTTVFETVTDKQGLPPISIETLTDGLRLRFTGCPGRKYEIQRAMSSAGPWITISTQTAPSSSLLQYDELNRPPGQAFY